MDKIKNSRQFFQTLGVASFLLLAACNGHDPSKRSSDLYEDYPELKEEYQPTPQVETPSQDQERIQELEVLQEQARQARDAYAQKEKDLEAQLNQKLQEYQQQVQQQQETKVNEQKQKIQQAEEQMKLAEQRTHEANALVEEVSRQQQILKERVEKSVQFSFSATTGQPTDETLIFTAGQESTYDLNFQVPEGVVGKIQLSSVQGLPNGVKGPTTHKNSGDNSWKLSWNPPRSLFTSGSSFLSFLVDVDYTPQGKVDKAWQQEDKRRTLKLVVVPGKERLSSSVAIAVEQQSLIAAQGDFDIAMTVFDPTGAKGNELQFWSPVLTFSKGKDVFHEVAVNEGIRILSSGRLISEDGGATWSVPVKISPTRILEMAKSHQMMGDVHVKVKIVILGSDEQTTVQELNFSAKIDSVQGDS